ncbi:MAG TPA: alpha/beta hydrolase [Solirubrobacteraceae bacterium]|nr:alpha/beta hydrolase [Solirubrobacteraceae bacterium]
MSKQPAELALLLHGQPGAARDWERVQSFVDGRMRTLAIDRPGWRPGSEPTDLAGNAAAALAALDAHGARRAVVVGHSLGAAVAAWLAAERPERVSRLVLAAPAANRASLVPLDYWLARPMAGELAGAVGMAVGGLALLAAPVRQRIARALALEERYLTATARGLLSPSAWRAFAADQRALVRDLPALEQRLPTIAAPTTIVAGSADRIVPPSSARALASAIPSAQLVVLEGAGHLLTQRQAPRLAELIVA